jgi:hypothetical protein
VSNLSDQAEEPELSTPSLIQEGGGKNKSSKRRKENTQILVYSPGAMVGKPSSSKLNVKGESGGGFYKGSKSGPGGDAKDDLLD